MKFTRELKIGIVVTLSIAALIWGINFLKGKNILSTNNNYSCLYQRIDGLQESSPVFINGYKIGLVDDIKLLQDKKRHYTC